MTLQSDRGTVRPPCRLKRLPTDPDIYATNTLNPLTNPLNPQTLPDKMKRTRTGSLNEKMLRIPYVEITAADFSSNNIFDNDIDTTLLSPKQFCDPYTPESVESHTPNADASGSDLTADDTIVAGLTRDRSVSPSQLKKKLDMLLSKDSADDKKGDKVVPELQRLNSRDSCKSGSSKKCGLCCLALKCYGFCRSRARRVDCSCSGLKCCTS